MSKRIPKIILSFLVDKASCTRQFESEFSLHSLASLFPIKEGIFSNPSVSLSKGSSTSNQAFLLRRKDVTALRCSEPLRSKVGGPSKVSPNCAGWDRLIHCKAQSISLSYQNMNIFIYHKKLESFIFNPFIT